ncbi:MAG TPA: pyrroline-5-carboxylate reductase [Tepidisphaeraceae bacterium]|jgi:pyrroline-5-carboxylate reductase
MTYELAIIGAGNMAEAIVRGVTSQGVLRPDQIIAADVVPQRRALFEEQLKVRSVADNVEAARQAKTILLSVKPQQMPVALSGIGAVIAPDTLVISIAAGIGTTYIERHLGARAQWRVVRSMPNTPMMMGEGMVALSRGAYATEQDIASAQKLFQAAADVIEVPEDKMNAVTAVSGSGPAYFFFLIEQMIKAGIDLGLSPDHARKLATKTALGAAKMAAESTEFPDSLRRKVTSPGGTTQAAIMHMESHNWPKITVAAIKAAEQRGKELGQ